MPVNPDNPYNRTDIAPGRWIVLCREDRLPDGTPGNYALATSSGFDTREDALHYMGSIAPSRDPLIAQIPG